MLNSSNFLLNIEIYVSLQHFTARIFVEFYENYQNILSNFQTSNVSVRQMCHLNEQGSIATWIGRQYCHFDWKAVLPLDNDAIFVQVCDHLKML